MLRQPHFHRREAQPINHLYRCNKIIKNTQLIQRKQQSRKMGKKTDCKNSKQPHIVHLRLNINGLIIAIEKPETDRLDIKARSKYMMSTRNPH